MLPVVVEAAVRATVVLLVVLLALKALRVRNPHILMAAWQMVLAASLLMPFLVVWAGFSMAPPRLVIPDIVTPELAGLAAVVAAPGPPSALSEMAPPVIAVTDATVLGTRVDGVLLIIQSGHTRREQAKRAKQQLEKLNIRIVGSVLTGASMDNTIGGYYAA